MNAKAPERKIIRLVKRGVTLPLTLAASAGRRLRAARAAAKEWSAKKIVTFDMDSTAVRFLETRGGVVKKWATIPLEPGQVEGGLISDRQALRAAVKQLSLSGIKASKVIASLSGLYSVNRIMAVPPPAPGVTAQDAALEMMRETMPLSEDQLYFSYHDLASGEEGRQVLAVGIPREMIDGEVRALKATGINPHILEPKSIALTRAVDREQSLILNIEPSSFDIVVVVGGLPEIIRAIPWQPDGLSLEERVEYLAVNLGLTVGFHNLHYHDTPLDPAIPLVITGQMSGDGALGKGLQARSGYQVTALTPSLEFPTHLPVSQYAVNIGLALKASAREFSPRATPPAKNTGQTGILPREVNFLPEAYRPWRPSARQLRAFGVAAGLLLLVIWLFQATTIEMDKTASLQSRYDILNNELQRRQLEIKNRLPLQKTVDEYNAIVKMGGNFADDLEAIKGAAEGLGIQVEAVIHQGDKITVTATAVEEGDYTAFRLYLTALEGSGRFATPIPPPEGFPYTWEGTIELKPKAAQAIPKS